MLLDLVVAEVFGERIIGVDGCIWLWMAHFNKGVAYHDAVLLVMKKSFDFGLSGQLHDIFNNVRDGVYRAVEIGSGNILVYMFVSKGEMATYIASCLRFGEVGSIAANVEYNSTSGVSDRSIWM